jgi:hypothetical protein
MPNIRHAFVNPIADQAGFTGTKPSDWNAQLQYTDGAGAPSGTDVYVRETLITSRTYYVRTDGSDSNTGLVNSAGGAFLTLQHAYDVITQTLDLGGQTVTVSVGAGTYTTGCQLVTPWTGGGTIIFSGDTTTPSNVFINSSSGAGGFTVTAILPGGFNIQGFKFAESAGFGGAILHFGGGSVTLAGKCDFGSCTGAHIWLSSAIGQVVLGLAAYDITGQAGYHILAEAGGTITQNQGCTVTLSGTQAYNAFAWADNTATIIINSASTFSGGTITGKRYNVIANAVVNVNSNTGGANVFPGNVAGTTSSGGQYVL